MSINPITGIIVGAANPQSTQRSGNARLSESPAGITGGAPSVADNASVSSTQLPSSFSSLYQAALVLAQNVSLSETAGQGIGAQQDVLAQLQQLATEASNPSTAQSARNQLDNVFRDLLADLNNIGSSTSFKGQPLLAGGFSIPSDASGNGASNQGLSLPNLTASGLFGGQTPSLQSADSAQSALTTLTQAGTALGNASDAVSGFGQQAQYASATVESALFNQAAANSTLTEADFSKLPASFTPDVLQQAQNQLPPSLLSLLSA